MKFKNPFRLAVACGALAAAALFAQSSGVVIVTTPGVNASFNVDIPADAESYQVTVYDHDGWWNPDDVLQSSAPADTKGPDGTKPKTLNIQVQLSCVEGIVCGGAGSSGESSCEVYVVVTWYSKAAKDVKDGDKPSGSTETDMQQVSCN